MMMKIANGRPGEIVDIPKPSFVNVLDRHALWISTPPGSDEFSFAFESIGITTCSVLDIHASKQTTDQRLSRIIRERLGISTPPRDFFLGNSTHSREFKP